MKIRKRYDDLSSKGITFVKPSMTQQHFKDECDINVIVRRFNAGQINNLPVTMSEGFYADVSDITSFEQAQAKVSSVRDYFAQLPSSIRERFNNSVDEFVSFASSSDSRQAFIDMGLLEKPAPAPAPEPAPVDNSGSAPAPTGTSGETVA